MTWLSLWHRQLGAFLSQSIRRIVHFDVQSLLITSGLVISWCEGIHLDVRRLSVVVCAASTLNSISDASLCGV